MNNKIEITPLRLVLLGAAIIILGVLIPSLFINAFSTIGFSIIIGLLVLVSAYVFFSINTIKSKGARTIKWLLLPFVIILLVGGAFYANHVYQQSQADKIYAVGETVRIPGLDFKVTKFTEEAVPLNTDGFNLSDHKNCNGLSGEAAHDCDWYNWPRRDAQNYISEHKRVTVNYEVTAKNLVSSSNLNIKLLTDSGREFNKNNGYSGGDNLDFLWALGYEKGNSALQYSDSSYTNFGGDVNKGITRNGTISVDLKNSERVFDVIVKYNDETRTVRINR